MSFKDNSSNDVLLFFFFKKLNRFDFKIVREHVKKANKFYGGYNPVVTNVASVQGSCDPWHTLGITNNNTQGVEGIFIEGKCYKNICFLCIF